MCFICTFSNISRAYSTGSKFCICSFLNLHLVVLHLCGTLSITATAPVLSILPCKRKLDAEKSKYASMAQQNGFGPAFLLKVQRLVEGTAKHETCCRLAT